VSLDRKEFDGRPRPRSVRPCVEKASSARLTPPSRSLVGWGPNAAHPQIPPHILDDSIGISNRSWGGSLFLEIAPASAISRRLRALIETWQAIRCNALGSPGGDSPPARKGCLLRPGGARGGVPSARRRFIYLNKGAFNGLYRVNRRSVQCAMGAPKSGFICDRDNLLKVATLKWEIHVDLWRF